MICWQCENASTYGRCKAEMILVVVVVVVVVVGVLVMLRLVRLSAVMHLENEVDETGCNAYRFPKEVNHNPIHMTASSAWFYLHMRTEFRIFPLSRGALVNRATGQMILFH